MKEVNKYLYSKNATSQGRVWNEETDLDTVLDKTSFKGYQQFISVYNLSCNSTHTLKTWPGFKIFPFNLCQITPTRSTYPLLASSGNPTKVALGCCETHNVLCLTCLRLLPDQDFPFILILWYCHNMTMLSLLGVNHPLPLFHMAKRFIWINETKKRINYFTIGYMINPCFNVYKDFREQVKTFM